MDSSPPLIVAGGALIGIVRPRVSVGRRRIAIKNR